jgi:hypothetical protein
VVPIWRKPMRRYRLAARFARCVPRRTGTPRARVCSITAPRTVEPMPPILLPWYAATCVAVHRHSPRRRLFPG